jgi:hypothetical protein
MAISFTPGQLSETVDVRYDDFIVRKLVSNEPVISFSRDIEVSVKVPPSLAFSVSGRSSTCNGVTPTAGTSSSATTVALGRLNAGTAMAAQDLTINTNAASGYVVYMRATGDLASANHTWASNVGSNLSPQAFPLTGEAFGYTSDSTLNAVGDGTTRFQPDKWAAIPLINDEIATGSATSGDTACVGFQAQSTGTTPAGAYTTTILYTAVATY